MPLRRTRLIVVLLAFAAIGATLVYTLRVQAQEGSGTRFNAQHTWLTTSNIPSSMEILRPSWLPPSFRHHPEVGSSVWAAGDTGGGYDVFYCAADCFSMQPMQLDFALNPYGIHHKIDSVFRMRVRGTTGSFSIYRSGTVYEVSWREAGQRYAVIGNKVWPSELLKVVASLHPVARTR